MLNFLAIVFAFLLLGFKVYTHNEFYFEQLEKLQPKVEKVIVKVTEPSECPSVATQKDVVEQCSSLKTVQKKDAQKTKVRRVAKTHRRRPLSRKAKKARRNTVAAQKRRNPRKRKKQKLLPPKNVKISVKTPPKISPPKNIKAVIKM